MNKTILVSIYGVNRPVTFNMDEDVDREKQNMFQEIQTVFADIISSNSISKPIFIVKNEEWNHEFVDIGKNAIPEWSVVRIIDAVYVSTITVHTL